MIKVVPCQWSVGEREWDAFCFREQLATNAMKVGISEKGWVGLGLIRLGYIGLGKREKESFTKEIH